LRDLHTVHGIAFVAQKSAIPVRTAPKPPPSFGISVHFFDFRDSQHRELLAIQSSANPGRSISKTFASLCLQKYPNSFSQNTKDHLHFARFGLNEVLKFGRNADTSCLCDRAATSAV
jgi:hypothetical protein